MKKLLNTVLILACFCGHISAQHIDEVLFGNTASETAHGFTTYHPANVQTFSGQANQIARRFLPDYGNPYAGSYLGTYGGELTIVMRVDGAAQNYFTVKFAGDSTNAGRILLNVDGKEVGHRHASNEELFMETTYEKLSSGAFFYRTAPIPRSLTNGKAFVTVRLRSSGWYFYYGSIFQYGTYQRTLDAPTTGVYKAYMHTNPLFSLPSNEVQGTTPDYAQGTATADNILTVKAGIDQKNKDLITSLLAGGNSLTSTDSYYNYIEVLAVAYNSPNNTVAFQNPAVITKIRNAIDQHVVNANNGTNPASQLWGGTFGRSAYGAALVFDKFVGLDSIVDLGGGAGLTRRAQWIKIFEASFNFGATNRKIISAQELEVGTGVYGAALGLKKLNPTTYANYPSVALHFVLEACGIEQCTGSMLNLTTRNPTLSAPSACPNGAGYYCMTTKGTSHESGWTSADCYGNLAPKLMELYYMTSKDPSVNAVYGAGNGDTRIRDKALAHTLTQTRFTYPSILKGKRGILTEGVICWRNVYLPGVPFYGTPLIAAATGNAATIGYVKQMENDGRLSEYLANDSKITWMHYLPYALETIANSTSTVQMPSTPNQPNYVVSDEENGVLGIKNGTEYVFVTLFCRATTDNDLGKVHVITPTWERKIELKSITSQYKASGSSSTRSSQLSDWSGDAPDKPISAYGGLVEPYVAYDGATAYNAGRQLKDFYQIQIGNYLIAMNCTKSTNKTITVPTALVGRIGVNMVTGASTSLPTSITLAPRTTAVYYIASLSSTSGLIADATATPTGVNKAALIAYVNAKDAFNIDPSTADRVSVNVTTFNYRHDLFDIFNQKLAIAKFIVQYPKATQTQVNTALTDVTTAYNNLVAGKTALINPYKRVEAEAYTSMSGVQNENCADVGGTLNVGYIGTGDYTAYDGCYFGSNGATKFIIRYGINPGSPSAKVYVRLDSPTGKLIGTITLPVTGSWQTYRTDSCTIDFKPTGIKNIYLVYENGLNVNWFQFDSTATCASTTNLALNKTATQSSLAGGDASRAVDGNTSGLFANNSVSHTNSDANAWWQVDLGSVNLVDVVKIFNRTDCCGDRLSNFYVFVSETPFSSTDLNTTLAQTTVKSYYFAGTAGVQTDIPFNVKGRYVRIQLTTQNFLHLAEVQVMGCNTTTTPLSITADKAAGTYYAPFSVVLTGTSGATIRYTTDGSTPTATTGTAYSAAIPINATTTLKAISVSGTATSTVLTVAYTIAPLSIAADKAAGTYYAPFSVVLTGTSGATIRYTTDGSTPTATTGTVYSAAIPINATTTLKAISVSGTATSTVLTVAYTITPKTIDLFVVAGQSNAQGFMARSGYPTNAIDSAILLNYTDYGNGGSNGWVNMQFQGIFGPEVTFSRNLKSAGYNPAIFKYTKGGTSLSGNWKAPGQGGIYDAMVVALKQAIIGLQNSGYTVKVRGMVWIQGESDTDTPANAAAYYNNVNMLINDMRKNVLKNACLPIVLGVDEQFPNASISRVVKADKTIADYDPYIVFSSMIGLPKADYTHLTPEGVIAHGKVVYDAYTTMVADTSKTPNCPITTTVCSTLTNLALNKTTTQISTGFSGASARAVDGNTNGVFSGNSVTHTSSSTNDWWQVDLGQVVNVDTVNIFNRTDCCTDRLHNFYVFASETAFTSTDLNTTLGQSTVKAHFYIDTAGIKSNIPLRTKARYIKIQLKGTNPLSLAEVQVIGCAANLVALSSKNTLTIDGRQEGGKALINWVSENNKAVDYFTLEKLNPTTGDFETLETLKNTQFQEVGYFTSYDNAPEEGENSYRIKRIATNGDVLFSSVKMLVFNDLQTIAVSPNPASDVLTITFDKSYNDKAIDITLMNVEGERIITQHIDKLQTNTHTLDIANHTSDGMYMLVIKVKGKRDVFKQVVITH